MKTLAIISALLCFAACSKKRDSPNDGDSNTVMSVSESLMPGNMGADSADLANFMALNGFGIYKFRVPSSFNNDSLSFCLREYYRGQLTDSISIGGLISLYRSNGWLRGYSRYVDAATEQFYVDKLLPFTLSFKLQLKSEHSQYQWTMLYDPRRPVPVKRGSEILLLTYSTSPLSEGKCVFCELPTAQQNFRHWYRQYGMNHYWVVSATFSGKPPQNTTL